jgi:hypothetical protein
MAGTGSLQLAPLSERLDDAEITELKAKLKEHGGGRLPKDDDSDIRILAEGLDDDLVRTFLDHLDDHDMACQIYLPVEFEGTFEVGELRVGSAQQLIDTLEELKDEFEVEDDEDEEEEDDEEEDEEGEEDAAEFDLVRGWSKQLWKLFFKGAKESVDRRLALHIFS